MKNIDDPGIKSDLRASLIAILVWAAVSFILPFTSGAMIGILLFTGVNVFQAFSIELGVLTISGLIGLAASTLAIILPIRRSVPARPRNGLYSFACLVLLIHLSTYLLTILSILGVMPAGRIIGPMVGTLGVVLFVIPLLIYSRKVRVLEGKVDDKVLDRIPSIVREERFPRFIRRDLERPAIFMVYAIPIGIVLALPLTFTYMHIFNGIGGYDDDDISYLIDHLEVQDEEADYSGSLSDMESTDYVIEANGTLLRLEAVLIWVDEAPGNRWTNDPDGFRIEVRVRNGEETVDSAYEEGANDPSDQGEIGCSFGYSEEDAISFTSIVITVTLEFTGEYHSRPFGLMTRSDDSNDFLLTLEYSYLP